MATIAAALAKVTAALKKAAAVKKYLNTAKMAKNVWEKSKKGIVTAILVIFFLPVAAVAAVIAPAQELMNMCADRLWGVLQLSQNDLYESMDDAYSFYTKLQIIDGFGTEERYDALYQLNHGMSCMNMETLMLIVGEVANYNDEIEGRWGFTTRTVYDEYRKEKLKSGEFPDISRITGNITEPVVQSANVRNVTGGTIVRGQGILPNNTNGLVVGGGLGGFSNTGNNNSTSGSPDLRQNNNLVDGFMDYVNNGGSQGNSNSGLVPGTGFVPVVTPRPSGGGGFATPPGVVPPNASPIPQLPTDVVSPDFIRPVITPSTPAPVATPEPTATPEPRYSVTYPNRGYVLQSQNTYHDGVSVNIKDIEEAWDCGPLGTYERMDKMDWQPLAALCCYYISMTPEKWGTYTGPEDTKYISKEKVQELIDIFAFEYTYVQEVQSNTPIDDDNLPNGLYEFNEYMRGENVKSPFKTVINTDSGPDRWGNRYRYTYRNPMHAPYRIANTYISYTYEYERKTEDIVDGGTVEFAYVKSLTYNIQPSRLIDAMRLKVPHFDENMYMYLLERMPRSEDNVAYFENVILADDAGELQTYVTTSSSASPTINVVTGLRQYSTAISGGLDMNGNASGMPNFGEDSTIIPLYAAQGNLSDTWYLNIKPHPDIVAEGETYGLYEVKYHAMAPLNVLDMTEDGRPISAIAMNRMVNSVEFLNLISGWENSPLLHNKDARDAFAHALYVYQEYTDCSVAGTLGIIKQEGGFTSRYAKNGYNYYNITGGRSWQYEKIGAFRNYKNAYEQGAFRDVVVSPFGAPAAECFFAQACWVVNNYWNDGQENYYRMIFNRYGEGATSGLGAYQQISSSYCPPYDDTAMPYSNDSYTTTKNNDGTESAHFYWRASSGARNRGWVNNCSDYRAKFLVLLQKAMRDELTPFVQ